MNGAEKIIDALVQLMDGYKELRESVEEELGASEEDDTDGVASAEVEANLANEVRAAVESFIESEGFAADELAPVVVHLTSALEEIDPDVFESAESEDEDEDEDEELDDEDDEDFDEDDEDEDEDDEDEDDD